MRFVVNALSEAIQDEGGGCTGANSDGVACCERLTQREFDEACQSCAILLTLEQLDGLLEPKAG